MKACLLLAVIVIPGCAIPPGYSVGAQVGVTLMPPGGYVGVTVANGSAKSPTVASGGQPADQPKAGGGSVAIMPINVSVAKK